MEMNCLASIGLCPTEVTVTVMVWVARGRAVIRARARHGLSDAAMLGIARAADSQIIFPQAALAAGQVS